MSTLHDALGLDGEARVAALRATAADGDEREELARHLALERLLALHLRRRDLAPRILERLPQADEAPDAFTQAVMRRLPQRRRRWAVTAGLALAAGLVVAVGLALRPQPTADPAPAALVAADATPAVHRYADGSRLVLGAGRLRPTPDGGELLAGRLHVQVAPRGAAQPPFVLRSPHGSATVLGTAFSYADQDDALRVDVASGRVRVAAQGHEPIELRAGEGLVADAGGLRRHRLIADFEGDVGWDLGAWTQEIDQRLVRGDAATGVGSLRLELVVTPRADDGRGDWALAGTPYRPRDPGAVVACRLRVVAAAPDAAWGLHLGERDGDSWMVASGWAEVGNWFTASAALDQPPQKQLAFGGDGRFDPATVDRLSVSLSGAPCVLLVDHVIETATR